MSARGKRTWKIEWLVFSSFSRAFALSTIANGYGLHTTGSLSVSFILWRPKWLLQRQIIKLLWVHIHNFVQFHVHEKSWWNWRDEEGLRSSLEEGIGVTYMYSQRLEDIYFCKTATCKGQRGEKKTSFVKLLHLKLRCHLRIGHRNSCQTKFQVRCSRKMQYTHEFDRLRAKMNFYCV